MKLFIASFLMLVSASGVSIADNHLDTLVFTSSPQQCSDLDRTECKFQPDSTVALENAKSQFEWIAANFTKLNALGVVTNGDLTNNDSTKSGSQAQLKQSNSLFAILDKANVPYYFGLGANDLKRTCWEDRCAISGAMRLVNHVTDLKNKGEKNGRTVNFDFTQHEGYSRGLTQTVDVIGSLGYAVDMGKVYYIQLNNNDVKEDDVINHYVSGIEGGLRLATYNIQINPILNWLETTLEYAAQQGKIIVVSKYDANEDAGINDLLDKYHVVLRFAGQPAINPAQSKYISPGFSFEKAFLKLELNYDTSPISYKVIKVKNLDLTQQTEVTSGQLIPHEPRYLPGQYPKRNTIFSVQNDGVYIGYTTVSYTDPAGNAQTITSPNMLLGNVFTINIPKGSTRINANFNALALVGWKIVFGSKNGFDNLERYDAPVFCMKPGGDLGFEWITYEPHIDKTEPTKYFNTQTKC